MTGILKAGLIGSHIGKSRFALAQELLCKQADLLLDFTKFETADLPDFNFASHVLSLRQQGFNGVTVTHPFKTLAHALAQENSYPATLGASNLLRFNAQKISAYNTDYTGFKSAWQAQFGHASPGRVAMAGAGGVSRALIVALMELGATRIDLWDLNPELSQVVTREIDPSGQCVTAIQGADEIDAAVLAADGLLNATPMGMDHHPGMAFEPAHFGGQNWAFEAVYAPIETEFLLSARAAGLNVMSGFDLFRHMAVLSFEAYTGLTVDKSAAVEALRPFAKGL